MAAYSLSGKAASDLDGIYEYTILNFGLEQAWMPNGTSDRGLHRVFIVGSHTPSRSWVDGRWLELYGNCADEADVTAIHPGWAGRR